MWPWTKKVKAATRTAMKFVRAKFDSAQTSPDNMKHWANADFLSANAAANPAVRNTLRNRARYEVANNSYARGIVLTLANDCVGTGPRLQMLLGDGEDGFDRDINGLIEREFSAWAKAVDLPGKLRTMRMSRAQDGETFGLLFSNGSLQHPVKLDKGTFNAAAVVGLQAGGIEDRIAAAAERTAKGVEGLRQDVRNNKAEFD